MELATEGTSPPPSRDRRLFEALGPAVEEALKLSVKTDPGGWGTALFPVMAPAIRMAVAGALRDLVETLNQVLEQSLSVRSWRWRFEAARTGRTFAEVVILRSLIYRVEQVLLLHRETGLLLQDVKAPNITSKDTGLISGMLTAIEDFVRDSFRVGPDAGLRTVQVGELCVWVEQGPQAAVAAVIRGNPPAHLRESLRLALESIHARMGEALKNYRGDEGALRESRPALEGCLLAQFQTPKKRSYIKLWAATLILVTVAALWLGFSVRDRLRWGRYVEALKTQPGIVVAVSEKRSGQYHIEGLRDPISEDPANSLASFKIDPAKVAFRWAPYISLDPELQARRARQWFDAPSTARFRVQSDVLIVSGHAPHQWIKRLLNAGLSLPGIRSVRTADLVDSDLESTKTAIEARRIRFALGQSVWLASESGALEDLTRDLLDWLELVRDCGKEPRVEIVGQSDGLGSDAENITLSQSRARRIMAVLLKKGLPAAAVTSSGLGSREAKRQNPQATEDPLYRTVFLRLTAAQAGSEPADR